MTTPQRLDAGERPVHVRQIVRVREGDGRHQGLRLGAGAVRTANGGDAACIDRARPKQAAELLDVKGLVAAPRQPERLFGGDERLATAIADLAQHRRCTLVIRAKSCRGHGPDLRLYAVQGYAAGYAGR
jgi:hypothetical protein